MARVGIAEAATRLGLSVDGIRHRVRKGELNARRDNKGVWWVDVPDEVPMQPAKVPMLAPAYAVPMQDEAALVDLRAQVTDLQQERDRLLILVETIAVRQPADGMAERVLAAERRAVDLQVIIDRELAELRHIIAELATQRRPERQQPRRQSS